MKLIINNTSKRTDLDVLSLVHRIIQGGLVSDFGKAYCSLTIFTSKDTGEKTSVFSKRNSATSHTFTVSGG